MPDPVPAAARLRALLERFTRGAGEEIIATARSLDALLASFDRCRAPEERARIAEALARTAVKDDRIRAAFVRMLEDDPANGAGYLANYGDRRSLADLSRAVDRLALEPIGDCDVCAGEHLVAMAQATRVLGGKLSDEQWAKIDAVLARREEFWIHLQGSLDALRGRPPSAACKPRPGRNGLCHCGSGKKYKRCHLAADERNVRH